MHARFGGNKYWSTVEQFQEISNIKQSICRIPLYFIHFAGYIIVNQCLWCWAVGLKSKTFKSVNSWLILIISKSLRKPLFQKYHNFILQQITPFLWIYFVLSFISMQRRQSTKLDNISLSISLLSGFRLVNVCVKNTFMYSYFQLLLSSTKWEKLLPIFSSWKMAIFIHFLLDTICIKIAKIS